MVYSREHGLLDEDCAEGERTATLNSLFALLNAQVHPELMQVLKPEIERIGDLQRLKELLLVAPYTQSVEAFTKNLYE